MKLCPRCGAELNDAEGIYWCVKCGRGMLSEDEIIIPRCPKCGDELGHWYDGYYCYTCSSQVRKEDADCSNDINSDDDYDFEEPDYDSMIDNGDRICLNCTYWSVSPHGSAYGMICRRNYPTSGPADSCSDFVQSHHFASYGDEGQYQFNETRRDTASKLYHWRNNR